MKVDAKDSDSGHINAFMAREVMDIDAISERGQNKGKMA